MKRVYPLIIVVLLAFYAALAFCVLHPAASVAYAEYFLSDHAAVLPR